MNMVKFGLRAFAALAIGTGATVCGQVIYGNTSSSNGYFYFLDLDTGNSTPCLEIPSGNGRISGLAVNELEQRVYWLEGSNQLRSVDYDGDNVIAHATLATTLNGGLALDTSIGILYGSDGTNLYEINLATGATILVGAVRTIGGAPTNLGGLDYDPIGDLFYATDDNSRSLIAFDPAVSSGGNISATIMAPYPVGDTDVDGLAMGTNAAGQIVAYLVNDDDADGLYVYNVATASYELGHALTLGAGGAFSGGAWAPSFRGVELSSNSVVVDSTAGSFTVDVLAKPGLAWTASTLGGWLTVTPSSGIGDTTVTVSYTANTSGTVPRTGQIEFPGAEFDVQQDPATPFSSLSPTSAQVGGAAGSYDIAVSSNLSIWNASTPASWVSPTIVGGGPFGGSDNGTVRLDYSANTGASRSAVITIAGATHTIVQTDDHGSAAGTATTLLPGPVTVAGTMYDAFDTDHFRIDLPTQADVRLFTTGSLDTRGLIYQPTGLGSILANDPNADDDAAASKGWVPAGTPLNFGTQLFLQKGTYYLELSNDGTPGPYTLQLEVLARSDFNGDERPDLLWQHANNESLLFWGMNNTTSVDPLAVTAQPGAGWRAVGLADFSGDLRLDILLQYPPSGQLHIWSMNGATVTGSVPVLSQPPNGGYEACSTRDFNGDGVADVLWRDRVNGFVAVWLMNTSLQAPGSLFPQVQIGTDWRLADAGDFNKDGNFDLVWQNFATGQVVVWYLNEGLEFIPGGGALPPIPGPRNRVVDTADYNLDGSPDVVFQNLDTGDAYVWYCDGLNVFDGGLFSTQVGTPIWKIRNSRNGHSP